MARPVFIIPICKSNKNVQQNFKATLLGKCFPSKASLTPFLDCKILDELPDQVPTWGFASGPQNTQIFSLLTEGTLLVFTDHVGEKIYISTFRTDLTISNVDHGTTISKKIWQGATFAHVFFLKSIERIDLSPEEFYRKLGINALRFKIFLSGDKLKIFYNNFSEWTKNMIAHNPEKTVQTSHKKIIENPLMGHIYLIYDHEDRSRCLNVFKIGKTLQNDPSRRLHDYGKHSILLKQSIFLDVSRAEDDLISIFAKHPSLVLERGREYFRGDFKLMLSLIEKYEKEHVVAFENLLYEQKNE